MAQNELDIIIKVQSDMKKQMDANTKAVEQMRKKTEKSVNSMEQKFRNLGKVVEGVMASTILKAGANMIKSSEKQSLALAILKTKSKDVYDQLLQTESATFGLANKFDMVTAANKAMAFGIDVSNGRLKDLMKISSKLAAVMGIETKQAFDDLITSSARQQKLIADNLGIMIDKVKVDQEYAETLGKTASELTEMEQSQAFLNEILKKGAVITGDLTDEFIKMNTKGTQAVKTLETAFTTSINVIASGFVGLGEGIGEFFARIQGYQVNEVAEGLEEYKKYYAGRQEEIEKEKEQDEINIEERLQAMRDNGKTELEISTFFIEQQRENQKQYLTQSFETWKKYYDARKELAKRFLADEKAQAKLELDIEEEFSDDVVFIGGRVATKSNVIKMFDKSAAIIDKIHTDNRKKRKSKKQKKAKDPLGLSEGLESFQDEFIEMMDNAQQVEKASIDFHQSMLDLTRRNNAQKLDIMNKDREREEKAQKKSDKAIEREKEKHFGMMKRFGSDYLDAIISGNADKIPEILAQQAMMFGQELVWDGIKTLWMGTAKNALFPGLGASAMAVGAAEIGIGVGMMGAGYAGSQALSNSSSGDSGANERNTSRSNENQDFNFNVTTSLYGSEVKGKREIRKLLS